DGKYWHALTDTLKEKYIINWEGKEAIPARYVRMRKLPSKKTNWVAMRMFNINHIDRISLGFDLEASNPDKAMYIFDKNPTTSYTNNEQISFSIPPNTKTCTILLKLKGTSVQITQYTASGMVSKTFNESFVRFDLVPDTKRIMIDGNAEIFEVILQ
ncbi:MAG: hypothetical protein ACRC0A_01450, partial [Chitinophagaceae bacterium]